MSPDPNDRRRNGFSRPYSPLQMTTWITLPLLLVQFFLFCAPVLPVGASIPCSLLFFGLALYATCNVFLACATDPMDLHLAKSLKEQGRDFEPRRTYIPPSSSIPADEETKYCWVCETTVAEHAMHCKYCNKCISHFDHHCLWLNNCVSATSNYNYFLRTLYSLSAFLLVHMCVLLGLVVDYFVDGATLQRAKDWANGADVAPLLAAVWIFTLVFDGIAVFLLLQLLVFHIQLQRQKLTTYQFIIKDSQRRRDEARLANKRAGERGLAILQARERGEYVRQGRLVVGSKRFCQWCDPLPPTKDELPGLNDLEPEEDAAAAAAASYEHDAAAGACERCDSDQHELLASPKNLSSSQSDGQEGNGVAVTGEDDAGVTKEQSSPTTTTNGNHALEGPNGDAAAAAETTTSTAPQEKDPIVWQKV